MLEPLVQHVKPIKGMSVQFMLKSCRLYVMLVPLAEHQLQGVKPRDNVSSIYNIIMKTV